MGLKICSKLIKEERDQTILNLQAVYLRLVDIAHYSKIPPAPVCDFFNRQHPRNDTDNNETRDRKQKGADGCICLLLTCEKLNMFSPIDGTATQFNRHSPITVCQKAAKRYLRKKRYRFPHKFPSPSLVRKISMNARNGPIHIRDGHINNGAV